jgi:hypothetical protein
VHGDCKRQHYYQKLHDVFCLLNSLQENAMNELNLNPVPQTDRVFSLSMVSAPTSVSTADGLLRTESHRFEERLAAVRSEAREQGVDGGCGGVGGGWGN